MRVFHAPGRVNLIGDHIDYLGGTVLPMAIDRGTRVTASARGDRVLTAVSANFPDEGSITCPLDAEQRDPVWGWANYLVAVAHEMAAAGYPAPHGFDVHVHGSIPPGSGLSSSASLELAFAVAIDAFGGYRLDPVQLAIICQAAENRFIGVACGIMDQLSIAAGRKGHALAIDCTTLDVTHVPFPDEVAVVVANTNQRRELADSAYNDRRRACERAQDELGRGRLVDLDPLDLPELLAGLDPLTARRVRHVVTEQARVLRCAQALAADDVSTVGRLMRQSHESLRDDFEVTGAHLDALAEAAWDTPGVIGARMTGAGFGGCTVNLVRPDAIDTAIAQIGRTYRRRTGSSADFYLVDSDDGAREVTS